MGSPLFRSFGLCYCSFARSVSRIFSLWASFTPTGLSVKRPHRFERKTAIVLLMFSGLLNSMSVQAAVPVRLQRQARHASHRTRHAHLRYSPRGLGMS